MTALRLPIAGTRHKVRRWLSLPTCIRAKYFTTESGTSTERNLFFRLYSGNGAPRPRISKINIRKLKEDLKFSILTGMIFG
jgi:hypothetical protein